MILGKKKKTHSLFLRCYYLFLTGCNDEGIKEVGLSLEEIHKVKKFHQYMMEKKYFYTAANLLGIDGNIAKKMAILYEEKLTGKPLSFGVKTSRETRPRIILAFSMLLDGYSDEKMKANCTECEITKAKLFLPYAQASDTMLTSTISMKTGILRNTVKVLLKLYRYKQKEKNTEQPSAEERSDEKLPYNCRGRSDVDLQKEKHVFFYKASQ